MSYVIRAKRYISNNGSTWAYDGTANLHIPNIKVSSANIYTTNGQWAEFTNLVNDNGFYIWGSNNPVGGTAIETAPSLASISSANLFTNGSYMGTVHGGITYVEYRLITTDQSTNKRVIRFKLERDDFSEWKDTYSITFQFILNDTIKFSRNTTFLGTQILSWSGDYIKRLNYVGTCIPWKGKYQGHDALLALDVNCGYNYDIRNPESDPTEQTLTGTCYESNYLNEFNEWLGGYEPEELDEENPYIDGGTSEEGGGGGNFSDDTDDPTIDSLPSIDAVGTGMATLFTPSKSQLRALSQLFWNSNVFTLLQNLVENITNMFVSLAMVPFTVQAGSTVSVTWLGIDTAVSLTLAAKQFYEFDMGAIDLGNDARIFTSGSALDYAPFSSLGIYLPFIGYRDLDIDECRGAVIHLRYRIDILSGSCVAIIRVAGKDIYEFSGNCLTQIPITNENMQSLVSDAVNVGLAIAGAQAAGAVASGVEADALAEGEALTEEKSAHLNQMVGRSRGQLASATANTAMGMKPNYAKSGAVSGSVAMMAVKQPYLFLRSPRQSLPNHYQRYCGFPSNISGKLGEFSGYTVVEDIRLNGLVATSPEVAEIYKLLKSGVII